MYSNKDSATDSDTDPNIDPNIKSILRSKIEELESYYDAENEKLFEPIKFMDDEGTKLSIISYLYSIEGDFVNDNWSVRKKYDRFTALQNFEDVCYHCNKNELAQLKEVRKLKKYVLRDIEHCGVECFNILKVMNLILDK